MLLEALDADVIDRTPESFYYLARSTYVKDEGLIDRFDQVFAKVFRGIATSFGQQQVDVPADWLRAVAEKYLTPEEMAAIKSLGSWDEIMETLKQRLEEQQGRHQGGNKWVGTGGTSPYGNSGYNPEGVRIGGESTHKRALKVWDQREFQQPRQHPRTRHAQHQDRDAPAAPFRARRRGGRTGPGRDDQRHRAPGLARHPYAARTAQCGEAAAVPRCRRLDGPVRQAVRGVVLRRHRGIQEPRILLFPQLPIRRRVEGQSPPLFGTHADLGRAPQIRSRL